MPPQALLARLDSRLRLLTSGPRDIAERQQTLRATIDWSYSLLDQAEQRLFRRLGVFVGGCTLEAAEAVCGAGDEAMDVLDSLAALVDKSMLQHVTGASGEQRFVMLETIREYACELMSLTGEVESLHAQHAAYFVAFAEKAEPELHGARQLTWLDRLTEDYANFRAVLAWTARAAGAPEDVKQGLRLVSALFRVWFIHSYLIERWNQLSPLLERAAEMERGVQERLALRLALSRTMCGGIDCFLDERG